MTSNQIAYMKNREEQRHNFQMEAETYRSNVAKENENRRANDLNYNASIYASQASMYNAKLNYDSNIYSAQMHAAASNYASELNYRVNEYKINKEDFNRDADRAETARHNREMEEVAWKEAGSKSTSSWSNVINTVTGVVKLAHLFAVT